MSNSVFCLWSVAGLFSFVHGERGWDATAHLAGMWTWEPSVLLGCAGLLLGYMLVQRFRPGERSLFFTAGVLVLLLALISPLHPLGEIYLFSAHMLQHLLLVLIVPPLLLIGIPGDLYERALRHPLLARAERVLGHPFPAWVLAAAVMWLWHIPAFYNATLRDHNLHIFEHLTFLVSGAVFWWPVLGIVPGRQRLGPPGAIVYLFLATASSSILGILLTFTPAGLYPDYLSPADPYGVLSHIRGEWGLTPAADQQLGGLIMWVPGCLAYLGGIIAMLARWYAMPEADEAPAGVEFGA